MLFGHVSSFSGLAKTILQGTVNGKRIKCDRKRDRKTKRGQGWTLPAQQGQLKQEKMERGC